MIERITIPPFDKYQLSTFIINGDTVYIGHFGAQRGEAGNKLSTAEEQMEMTLKTLEKYLSQIDLSLSNVVKLNVYLRDIKDFDGMHRAWVKCFPENCYPVRMTVTTDFIDANCLVQVEGIACIDR